jgi:hypothetical protein
VYSYKALLGRNLSYEELLKLGEKLFDDQSGKSNFLDVNFLLASIRTQSGCIVRSEAVGSLVSYDLFSHLSKADRIK